MIKNFFDIFNCITSKQRPTDEEIDSFTNQWMINLLMSSDLSLAPLAFEMSKMKVTNRQYYEVLDRFIPKCKKYIRWNATKAKKEEETLILMQHFGCCLQNARQHAIIMDEAELKGIISSYRDLERGLENVR